MKELEKLAPHVRYDRVAIVRSRMSRTVIPRKDFTQQLLMDYRLIEA